MNLPVATLMRLMIHECLWFDAPAGSKYMVVLFQMRGWK
jgi:hypothetical protein